MPQQPRAQARPSTSSSSAKKTERPPPSPPRPSSSIILLSPTNEVLLLHRVQTSSAFPSAHVFPGGNLSSFHEPALPPVDSPAYHQDSPAYRLAAIRETFEESGLLLARRPDSPALVDAGPTPEAAAGARAAVHANELHFGRWVESELSAAPCVDDLVPFTRWLTPATMAKRFTTQMYLFLMPFPTPGGGSSSSSSSSSGDVDVVQTPTSDGGIEHTAATFAPAAEWLERQLRGEIVLFPPQLFLLTMVARVFGAVEVAASGGTQQAMYAAQRKALLEFVTKALASARMEKGGRVHPTALIPWTEKVMSPIVMFIRTSDKRSVLGLDKPGPELKGSGRGGDFERVVLVNFGKEGPRNVEVRDREEVVREEREAKEKEEREEKVKPRI